MKICYVDAFSGISGDMTVGALADAGASTEALIDGLRSLNLGAEYTFEKTKRKGMAATKFKVTGGETKSHRHLPHIQKIIDGANLPQSAKQKAHAVFLKLGEAEAKSHAVPMEKVHFHEVGAVDSISDIVAACLGFDLLGVEEIHCSALNVGGGTVNTSHGVLPVPAPATAELLVGKPVYSRGPQVELTTPTGAALVATLATSFGSMPPMSVLSAGYGAGDNDFKEQANVLRVLVGEAAQATEATTISVMEANIDDANPQVLAYAMDRLLAAGALDVTMTPVTMKKGRPGTILQVLAKPEDQESLVAVLFTETTTLGLRIYKAERRVQDRNWVEVETPFGKARVKTSSNGSFAPEYEDCKALATASGAPFKDVLAAAAFAYWKTRS